MSFKDLKKNYTPISADDAKASWVAEFEAGDDHCLHKASDKCPGANCDFGKRTQRCNCLATNSLLHTICKATKAKKRLEKTNILPPSARTEIPLLEGGRARAKAHDRVASIEH